MNAQPRWDRWRVNTVVGGIGLLSAAAVFTIRPALTYRIIDLEMQSVWIGLVGAAYAVAPLVVAPVLGNLSDSWGARRALLYGTLTMALSGVLLIPAVNVLMLLAGAIVLGLGHFVCLIGLQMAAGDHGRATSRFHQTFAMLSLSLSLGHILGPGALSLLGGSARIPPVTPILVFMTVGMMVCPILALLWHRSDVDRTKRDAAPWGALIRTPGLLSAVTISGLVVAAIDMTGLYLPLLGSERGLSSGFVGFLLVMRAVASASVRAVLSRLVNKWGARKVVIWGMVIATVAMGAIVLPIEPWLMVVAIVILGGSLGVADPITAAWSSMLAPAAAQGRAASLRFMANRTGQVIMPLLAAALAPVLGAAGGFLLVTLCLAGSGGLAVAVSLDSDE